MARATDARNDHWQPASLSVDVGVTSGADSGFHTVHLSAAKLPAGAAHEFLGTYDRSEADLVNERAVFIVVGRTVCRLPINQNLVNDHAYYVQRDNSGQAIWYSSQGNWVVGNTSNLGLDDEVAENITNISPLRPTQRARKMPWGLFMSQSN